MLLSINVKKHKKIVVLNLTGDLNINNILELKQIFPKCIGHDTEVICINCKDLSSLDMCAISLFVNFLKMTVVNNIEFILCGINHHISRLFKMSKIDNRFTFIPWSKFREKYLYN